MLYSLAHCSQDPQHQLLQIKNMIKKNFQHFFTLICLITLLVLPYFVFAQSPALQKLKNVGPTAGFSEATGETLPQILSTIISAFLGLLGIIFVVLMVYSGYNWMTAMGDESKVSKAQSTIKQAIIGLIITVSAYAITYFVFNYLGNAI